MKSIIDHIYENQQIIRSICRTYYSQKEDQEDLFQEIVIKIWKNANHFNHKSKFSTWLYRISLNTAITHKKKTKRIYKHITRNTEYQNTWMEEKNNQAEIKKLYKAIDKLNKMEKAIILLYLDEKSYEEMAEITGLTKTNVSVKLVRIKKKLEQIYFSLS